LTILFSFFILAALPLLILVILPTGSAFFVPYPFVYSLFLFAPAGYFFVLHRHGYLVLDAVFGRIITIAMLLLAVGLAYAVGVFLLDEIFHIDFTGAWQGGLVLVLFGIAVVGQKPVQTIVDVLLYGREPLSSESLREAKSRLYANPEPATVADVISQIATHLKVQQVAVMVKHGELYRLLAGNVSDSVVTDSQHLQDVCLRNSDSGWLDDLPTWVELSIPITARNEMLGLFFLSRPMNDYFNAQQVTTLLDVADILAFGLLVISLVESMQTLSREALYEKELQRHRIATEIHNEPLHTLTLATLKLQQEDSNEVIQEAANAIRQVTKDLRRIISGLRPPALKESVEWMTLQVVREFEEAQDDIYIDLHLDIRSDVRASEPTKYAYYYVLIEALNNVSRHAEASEVRVTLYYGEDSLTLEVKDNGVGSDVATLPLTELLRGHHVGIADMYKWASVGGGRLEIGANEPGGTTVRLVLPLIAHSDDTPHLL
jgi:signal transduction histidine kinase